MNKSDIVLFETKDSSIILPVRMTGDTVWLNRSQMAELFERDVKTIGKHISNALREEVDSSTVAKFATVQEEGNRSVTREIEYYNLDMIISVGYRVKSNRGVEFRKWANRVLRQYILQGYAVNERRINQLGEVVRLMKRTQDSHENPRKGETSKKVINKGFLRVLEGYEQSDKNTFRVPRQLIRCFGGTAFLGQIGADRGGST